MWSYGHTSSKTEGGASVTTMSLFSSPSLYEDACQTRNFRNYGLNYNPSVRLL